MGTAAVLQAIRRCRAVHPHRRGDGTAGVTPIRLSAGSPPQAWGRRRHGRGVQYGWRFTPTGVGTARSTRYATWSGTVHPHRRGDGSSIEQAADVVLGSPPQAWGRLDKRPIQFKRGRFTPTGVGTATSASAHATIPSVHPHRRGDGDQGRAMQMSYNGSPPQAWGRPLPTVDLQVGGRFTPTGVGTAHRCCPPRSPRTVHPHRRGDGRSVPPRSIVPFGSPPQAWGRPMPADWFSLVIGFTPTGVGTAIGTPRSSRRVPVHPHRRGDGVGEMRAVTWQDGSPPQAWGRPSACQRRRDRCRFTPTGVGTALHVP